MISTVNVKKNTVVIDTVYRHLPGNLIWALAIKKTDVSPERPHSPSLKNTVKI
jgi:hypothetical protein